MMLVDVLEDRTFEVCQNEIRREALIVGEFLPRFGFQNWNIEQLRRRHNISIAGQISNQTNSLWTRICGLRILAYCFVEPPILEVLHAHRFVHHFTCKILELRISTIATRVSVFYLQGRRER